MNFKESIEQLINKCESLDSDILDDDTKKACEISRSFLNYLPIGYMNSCEESILKEKEHSDFCDDEEKMVDFRVLSKDEFLNSYPYISEEDYNLTRIKEVDKRNLKKS